MSRKNMHLIVGILAALVFLGYLSESGPHQLFGYSINIWIVRFAWLVITISSFANYYKLNKGED